MKGLSYSLINVNEIFGGNDIKEESRYLIVEFNDVIVKCLHYLHFWKEKKASKMNIVHLLKVMIKIVEAAPDDIKKKNLQVFYQFYQIFNFFKIVNFFIFFLS